jgi:Ca2+/Na+ antiporter
MYVQDKIWGKYASASWRDMVARSTIVLLGTSLAYLTYSITNWHPVYLTLGYLGVGFLCLVSYYSDRRYNQVDETVILSDFNKLSNRTRYLYLSYVFGCFIVGLVLILF